MMLDDTGCYKGNGPTPSQELPQGIRRLGIVEKPSSRCWHIDRTGEGSSYMRYPLKKVCNSPSVVAYARFPM
jgi:hypothetical protein